MRLAHSFMEKKNNNNKKQMSVQSFLVVYFPESIISLLLRENSTEGNAKDYDKRGGWTPIYSHSMQHANWLDMKVQYMPLIPKTSCTT